MSKLTLSNWHTCIASFIPLMKFGQFFTALLHNPNLVKLDAKSPMLLAITCHRRAPSRIEKIQVYNIIKDLKGLRKCSGWKFSQCSLFLIIPFLKSQEKDNARIWNFAYCTTRGEIITCSFTCTGTWVNWFSVLCSVYVNLDIPNTYQPLTDYFFKVLFKYMYIQEVKSVWIMQKSYIL